MTSWSLIHSYVPSNLPLVPISVWFFFIFSNTLLKFSLCPSILLSLLRTFLIITWTLSVRWLISTSLSSFFEVWSSYSFGTYSSVSSFGLILCVYFYAVMSVMFPNLGELAFCRNISYGNQQHTPLWSPETYTLEIPNVGCVGPSLVVGLTTVGTLVGGSGSQLSWLPGPASCSGC